MEKKKKQRLKKRAKHEQIVQKKRKCKWSLQYVEICSTLFGIREMLVKIWWDHVSHLSDWQKSKSLTMCSDDKTVAGGNEK